MRADERYERAAGGLSRAEEVLEDPDFGFAVILRREGDFVLRVDAAGKAERLAVKTGAAVDDLVEVSGDVRAGDRLIVRGGERVEPGQAVSVQPLAIALAMR